MSESASQGASASEERSGAGERGGSSESASRVRVRVPATSANLGPGFDVLGLALRIYDEIDAELAESDVRVVVTGEGAGELPDDERHLVAASALAAFDEIGRRPPGLRLACRNQIPQTRGLGSSAAAVVAGVLIARALSSGGLDLTDDDVLALASRLDGHADNVAPCLLGGLTVAWSDGGRDRAVRLQPTVDLDPVVLIPSTRSETLLTRQLLPDAVPRADAVANVGRTALLVHALTADPALLLPATEDRLHQPYRASAMPDTATLVGQLRSDGVPAAVSGAGPTVIALLTASRPGPTPAGWDARRPGIDRVGALATLL